MSSARVLFLSDRHLLTNDPSGGLIITRLTDGASVFLQPGDDSAGLREDLERARAAEDPRVMEAFAHALSEYDVVMTLPDTEMATIPRT
ncbi:MAG: hypothetical protein M0Z85_07585 [Gammaproteobacteria bacterium]|nr:hypothetical protein [Gammaproteobacteria bacterium]